MIHSTGIGVVVRTCTCTHSVRNTDCGVDAVKNLPGEGRATPCGEGWNFEWPIAYEAHAYFSRYKREGEVLIRKLSSSINNSAGADVHLFRKFKHVQKSTAVSGAFTSMLFFSIHL